MIKGFRFEYMHFEILPLAPLLCSWIQSRNCTVHSRADRRCFLFFLTLSLDAKITLFIFKISVRRLFESKYTYLFENRHFYDFPRTIHKFGWRMYHTQHWVRGNPKMIFCVYFLQFHFTDMNRYLFHRSVVLLVSHSKINYFLLLIGVRVYNIFRFVAFSANETMKTHIGLHFTPLHSPHTALCLLWLMH